jgi:hypothetical protein
MVYLSLMQVENIARLMGKYDIGVINSRCPFSDLCDVAQAEPRRQTIICLPKTVKDFH